MSKNTIVLKKYLDIQFEAAAAAAITPGMLVEITSSGTVQAHSTAGGNQTPQFAIEDALQGKTIADAYEALEQVRVRIAQRGDEIYALLKNGETAVIGSLLESDGAGSLAVHVADGSAASNLTNQIVGYALEALDLSDSSAIDLNMYRIQIRVI